MRKLATAAAVSLALASGGAFGLGLGDIEMQSALNQPMNAEIRLTAVRPGELDGMIVRLASDEAFERAGIEKSSALSELTFTVDQSSGNPVIRISSETPIIEPFLNFLLEVDWTQGRMVREYTVLLDPPVFMTPSATQRNTTTDRPAVVNRDEGADVVPTLIDRDQTQLSDGGVRISLDDLVVDEQRLQAEAGNVPTPAELLGEGQRGGDGTGAGLSLSDLDAQVGVEGVVVPLTDLGAPNTEALAERSSTFTQSFSLDDIQVELAGGVEEVTDDIVIDTAGDIVVQPDGGEEISLAELEAESTIVSLDEPRVPEVELPRDVAPTITTAEQRGAGQITVNSGDTLFEIAERAPVDGVSVQQMMMAMLVANESSFINGNINLVRAGSILRIPDSNEATRLSQSEAIAAINEQQQLWREYRDSLRSSGATRLAQNQQGSTGGQSVARSQNQGQGASAGAGGSDALPAGNASSVSQGSGAQQAGSGDSDTTAPLQTAAVDAVDGLSPEARQILENAREQIRSREELRIVADNAPSSTAASATADETTDNDAARLGEVNRKLQLAREELSATRLRGDDLTDQVSELESTTQNLDTLISLQQNEVARLESQLAQAREAAAADGQVADAGEAINNAQSGTTGSQALASDSTAAVNPPAIPQVPEIPPIPRVDGSASQDVTNSASDARNAAGDAIESGSNALTEAGQTLEQVDLIGEDGDKAGIDVAANQADSANAVGSSDASQKSWYQGLLQDPTRMAIAGIGGLGLLGVLGTLLFRRKRHEELHENMLDVRDEHAFSGVPDTTEVKLKSESSVNFGDTATAAAAGAGVAAVGGAVASGVSGIAANAREEFDDVAEDVLVDRQPSYTDPYQGDLKQAEADIAGLQAENETPDEDDLDPDDTIAEVDVYLAYGLHGQAEELLGKAVEANPENSEYAFKLLQTYHAQGNADSFEPLAEDFHARFGGDESPDWANIASMGKDLRPGYSLYGAAAGVDEAVDSSAESSANAIASVAEVGYEAASDNDMFDLSGDQAGLMEQSIDPAYAFDEGDLEATGDFSRITGDLAADDESSVEFPGFDDSIATAANENLQAGNKAADQSSSFDDSLNIPAPSQDESLSIQSSAFDDSLNIETSDLDDSLNIQTSDLDDSLNIQASDLDDSLNIQPAELDDSLNLDGFGESIDDLTLDLDQLSGELELDGSDLLNSDLNEIEIPEASDNEELLLDSTSAIGESGDEMDTMMDLAKAYIDMGDKDSASSALGEIVKSGSPAQVTEAETLLRKIS
ncbi:MAG: FimV/HubP family polar landmark protein [Granulosicoccus sp.]